MPSAMEIENLEFDGSLKETATYTSDRSYSLSQVEGEAEELVLDYGFHKWFEMDGREH